MAPKQKLANQRRGGGIVASKAEENALWYQEVLEKAELIEAYPVRGCFTLRPALFGMWEQIQKWFDNEIKDMGVENCYFPMFIPLQFTEAERKALGGTNAGTKDTSASSVDDDKSTAGADAKASSSSSADTKSKNSTLQDHMKEFAPELAWVTRCGDNEMEEPVALRPSSEMIMYGSFSKWIRSHRDLPLKINQWCNMIRWEVKQTTPLIRMRENLWQEGHTAFAEKHEAEAEVLQILELYAHIYEELLAVPVIRGTKTKAETFPGAEYSTTVEAFVPATARAVQGATSHHLGQRFSGPDKYDIGFQDPKATDGGGASKKYVWQNSWGIATRTLGVMVHIHGDQKGLVMAPRVATTQVVVMPVGLKDTDAAAREQLLDHCFVLKKELGKAGVRAKVDDRQDKSVGWKCAHWELKGVPLRLELGPGDLDKGECIFTPRVALRADAVSAEEARQAFVLNAETGKASAKLENAAGAAQELLDTLHRTLYANAKETRDARVTSVDTFEQFVEKLNNKQMLLAPFCGDASCEEEIKRLSGEATNNFSGEEQGLKSGAKSMCLPHASQFAEGCPVGEKLLIRGGAEEGMRCVNPGCKAVLNQGSCRTLFGRSY